MSEELVADQEKFVLRLPDGFRDRLRDAAKANGRSMNAEVIARLEYSFEGTGRSQIWHRAARKALNEPTTQPTESQFQQGDGK